MQFPVENQPQKRNLRVLYLPFFLFYHDTGGGNSTHAAAIHFPGRIKSPALERSDGRMEVPQVSFSI